MDDVFKQEGDLDWEAFRLPDTNPYYRSYVWGAGDGRRTVSAQGVHGQYIYVAPLTNIVIAVFSSWPNALGGEDGVGPFEALALIQAVEGTVQ